MSEDEDVKTDVEEESSTSDEKTVEELLQEGEESETPTETPEEPEEPVEDTSEEPDEEPTEEPEPEEEPEKDDRRVPLTALQRERAKRREEAQRAKDLEARLKALEESSKQTKEPELVEPKIDDFVTTEDYQKAMTDYVRKAAVQAAKSEVSSAFKEQQELAQRKATEEREFKIKQDFHRRLEKKMSDESFEEKFNYVNDLSMENPGLQRGIVISDQAPQIIEYLASNPDKAEQIASLSPEVALKEIGAIEARIKSPPKPKNVTKAPEPVKPVSGSGKTSKVKWKPNMSEAERKEFDEQAKKSGLSVMELYGLTE